MFMIVTYCNDWFKYHVIFAFLLFKLKHTTKRIKNTHSDHKYKKWWLKVPKKTMLAVKNTNERNMSKNNVGG